MRFPLFSWLLLVLLYSVSVLFATDQVLLVCGQCLEDQRDLLLQLNQSLSFSLGHTINLDSKLASWNKSTDCCDWKGVTCDVVSGHVTGLDLSSESISSGIDNSSSSLFSLRDLQSLNLTNNSFNSSPIPSGLVKLVNLTNLNLSNAGFGSQVPIEISRLRRLVSLDLSTLLRPELSRLEIPDLETLVRNLSGLRILRLDGVNISASGSQWGGVLSSALPNLQVLRLSDCCLSGPLDSSLSKLKLRILDLSNNQIHGEIYTWVWTIGDGSLMFLNLSFNLFNNVERPLPEARILNVIDLHSNFLQGPLPVLGDFSFPSYLNFSNNSFQSTIPSNLNPVLFLSLSSNNLTGEIPQSICETRMLLVLDLSYNNLSGTIPSCLVDNSETKMVLNLRHNNFVGQIPQNFPVICALRTLDLSWNRLEGPLPRALANCRELEVLNLENNRIDDTFPFWLGSFTDLQVLVLGSNKFNGPIKCEGGRNRTFSKLHIVDFSSNNFTGDLPSDCLMQWTAMADKDETLRVGFLYSQAIGRVELMDPTIFEFYLQIYHQDTVKLTIKGQETELTKIITIYTTIDLSNNGFEGDIPNVIGSFTALHFLNLSQNALTGPIPSSMGSMKQLESLDLSCNKLQGEIPQKLTSLTFLSVLNLSWNELTGRIPTGTQFQSFPETSYGGNEGLCGAPLSRNCKDPEPTTPPPAASSSKKPQLFGYDWDIVLSGFVVGFGGGAGIIVAFFLFSDEGRKLLLARS